MKSKDTTVETLLSKLYNFEEIIESQKKEIVWFKKRNEEIKNALDDRIEEVARLNNIASSLQISRTRCYEEIENQSIIIKYLENKLGLKGDTDEL